uniref:Photolyase/cryptochrome alpha/beta domain-containing protein n=1 Tax=Steinernema glaseri TaxID=37863 RepID=A0A1I7Y4V3_9BILA
MLTLATEQDAKDRDGMGKGSNLEKDLLEAPCRKQDEGVEKYMSQIDRNIGNSISSKCKTSAVIFTKIAKQNLSKALGAVVSKERSPSDAQTSEDDAKGKVQELLAESGVPKVCLWDLDRNVLSRKRGNSLPRALELGRQCDALRMRKQCAMRTEDAEVERK